MKSWRKRGTKIRKRKHWKEKEKGKCRLPAERVLLEDVERGFAIGQGEIDETQTTFFAVRVGRYVLRKDLVPSFYALETAVSQFCESGRTKQVGPFLLSTVFARCHCLTLC